MPAGRPRYTTPNEEEIEKLGNELIEWASTPPTPDNPKRRFADWYSYEKFMILNQWKALKKLPQFAPYYEKARSILARNYQNAGKDDTMNAGIAQRFMRHYCWDDVAEEENAVVEHAAKTKAQSDEELIQKSIVEKDNLIIQQSKQLLDLQRQVDELKGKNDNSLQSQTD